MTTDQQTTTDVTDDDVTTERILCGALVVERGWSSGYGCRREAGHDGSHSRIGDDD